MRVANGGARMPLYYIEAALEQGTSRGGAEGAARNTFFHLHNGAHEQELLGAMGTVT